MTLLQVFGICFSLIQIYFTFLHFKRRQFTIREALAWSLVWIVFGLITLYPESFSVVSAKFGALRSLDFFTIIGFIIVLSISFYTYIQVDLLRKNFERAVRELALREDLDPAPKKKVSRRSK